MLVGNKCDVSRRRRVVSFADGQVIIVHEISETTFFGDIWLLDLCSIFVFFNTEFGCKPRPTLSRNVCNDGYQRRRSFRYDNWFHDAGCNAATATTAAAIIPTSKYGTTHPLRNCAAKAWRWLELLLWLYRYHGNLPIKRCTAKSSHTEIFCIALSLAFFLKSVFRRNTLLTLF